MSSVVNSRAFICNVCHTVMPSGYSSFMCTLTVDQLIASNAHCTMHVMTAQLRHVTGVDCPPGSCQYLARCLAQSLFFLVSLIGGSAMIWAMMWALERNKNQTLQAQM